MVAGNTEHVREVVFENSAQALILLTDSHVVDNVCASGVGLIGRLPDLLSKQAEHGQV